jgi:hypothetical protein
MRSFAGGMPLTNRPKAVKGGRLGPMAEWLRRGLQILARRFDSGSGLHLSITTEERARRR